MKIVTLTFDVYGRCSLSLSVGLSVQPQSAIAPASQSRINTGSETSLTLRSISTHWISVRCWTLMCDESTGTGTDLILGVVMLLVSSWLTSRQSYRVTSRRILTISFSGTLLWGVYSSGTYPSVTVFILAHAYTLLCIILFFNFFFLIFHNKMSYVACTHRSRILVLT